MNHGRSEGMSVRCSDKSVQNGAKGCAPLSCIMYDSNGKSRGYQVNWNAPLMNLTEPRRLDNEKTETG